MLLRAETLTKVSHNGLFSPGLGLTPRASTIVSSLAVQWFRARFNECFEKAEIAKSRCGDGEYNVFTDKILYDKAMEIVSFSVSCSSDPFHLFADSCTISRPPQSRAAAINEALGDDLGPIEQSYETAILMWRTVLDDTIREGKPIEEEDKATIDKCESDLA